jgi:hypothetical protein
VKHSVLLPSEDAV